MAFHALTAAANASGAKISLERLVTLSGEAFALAWSESVSAVDLLSLRPEATWLNGARTLGAEVVIGQEKNPEVFAEVVANQLALGQMVFAPIFNHGRIGVIDSTDDDMQLWAVGPDYLVPKPVDVVDGRTLRFPGNTLPVTDGYVVVDMSRAAVPPSGAVHDKACLVMAPSARDLKSGWPHDVTFGVRAAEGVAGVIQREMLADTETLHRLLVFAEQAEFGFECAERWLYSTTDAALHSLGRHARSVRAVAGELAERLWDRTGQSSPGALAGAVTGRKSMVFEMPIGVSAKHVPGTVIDLPRGRAVIVESQRRLSGLARLADLLVRMINDFERGLAVET